MLALWSATYSPKAAFADTVTAIETRQHVDPNGIAIEPTSGSVFVTFPPSIDSGDEHGQIIVYDGDPFSLTSHPIMVVAEGKVVYEE